MKDSKYVIIVEPSDVMRTLLECVVVFRLGWEADVTITGAQAWELIQNRHPDLVIADGYLEGPLSDPGGVDLCRRMRNDPHLWHIPVVLTSISGSEAREAGAAASLLKPFSLDDLLLAIHQVLGESYRSETDERVSPQGREQRKTMRDW